MARFAVTLAMLGMFAACTQEVDDPTFNDDGGAGSGSSGSGSSEGDTGPSSNTQGSNSNTSATTSEDEESSGGGGGSTSGAAETGADSATTGAAGCGDGMISPGEQCDGADLQGFDCTSLGLSGGTLSCDPVTCTFDTSMCMSTTGGTSG